MSRHTIWVVLAFGLFVAAGCGADGADDLDRNAQPDVGADSGVDSSVDDDAGDSGPVPERHYGDEYGPADDEPDDFEYDVFAASCDGGRDRECLEPADNTVVLDKERRYGIISARPMGGWVELKVRDDSPLRERLARGTYIVRRRPGRRPLMHRVTGIRWNQNTAQVQTERAALRDVYRRGRIRQRFRVSEALTEMQRYDGYRTVLQPVIGFEDCSGPIIDPFAGPNAQLSAELTQCQFTFDPEIYFEADWWGSDAHVELIGVGNFKALADVQFIAQGALSTDAKERVLSIDVPLPTIPLLSVVIDVDAGYEFSANAELEVRAGFDYESTVEVGFLWEGARPFHVEPIWHYSEDFSPIGPFVDFDGELDAEVYLHPKIGLSVLNSLNGQIGLRASANLGMNADLTTQPTQNGYDVSGMVCYDLSAGLNFTIGGEINPLGMLNNPPELEYSSGTILFELVPEGTCVDFESVMQSSCTESDECIVDSDCVADLRPACSLPVCQTDCSCGWVEIPDCCTRDDECDDGEPSTDDFCDDTYNCAHVTERCFDDDGCNNGGEDWIGECVTSFPGDRGYGTCTYHRRRSGEHEFLGAPECTRADECPSGETCINSECRTATAFTDPCDGVICDDNNALTVDSCNEGACVFTKKRTTDGF